MSPTTRAKIVAAGHSLWITALALSGGMWLDAVGRGAATPQDLLHYAKTHWVAFIAANVIAPAIRAYREPGDSSAVVNEAIPLNGVATTPSNPTQPAQAPGKV